MNLAEFNKSKWGWNLASVLAVFSVCLLAALVAVAIHVT